MRVFGSFSLSWLLFFGFLCLSRICVDSILALSSSSTGGVASSASDSSTTGGGFTGTYSSSSSSGGIGDVIPDIAGTVASSIESTINNWINANLALFIGVVVGAGVLILLCVGACCCSYLSCCKSTYHRLVDKSGDSK